MVGNSRFVYGQDSNKSKDQFDWWSNDTVRFMFDYADKVKDFKLFFSFDHGAKILSGNPMQYADYFKSYSTRDSYFTFKDPKNGVEKPLLSTFGGENVPQSQWSEFKAAVGDVLIVPGFYEATPSANFFNSRGSIDGIFNWNSWQPSNTGKIRVSSADDVTYHSATTKSKRVFMMGISPVQFKHLSDFNNWYRRGEDNLEYRLGQALDVQPDIIQLQSWNDAGEGHYMGNLWPEPLDDRTKLMTDAYPHQGYWEILPAFIQAWKRGDRTTANMFPTNGKAVQGAFWHHTLTVAGTCPSDKVKKANDITNIAEDAVSGVVLVPRGKTNLVSVVNVGGKKLNQTNLRPGYNTFKYTGMGTGKVQLEVWDESTMVGRGEGKIAVTKSAAECNYNFQVVGFPS
jgi:glucan endo-1,3-alpha-glucosidase